MARLWLAAVVGSVCHLTCGAGSPFVYNWKEGSLAPGYDALSPTMCTRDIAESLCTAHPPCRAFAFQGTNKSSEPHMVFFSNSSVAGNKSSTGWTTWSTWIKTGLVTAPALSTEVGQSGLKISLREGTFQIQSISPIADPWGLNYSFMRELNTGNALPGGVLLGDITIRLRNAAMTGTGRKPDSLASGDNCANTVSTKQAWATYSTAGGVGAAEAKALGHRDKLVLAAHDVSPLLSKSAPESFPLLVHRTYEVSSDLQALLIRFVVSLPQTANNSIEIGGLGFAMPESAGPGGIEASVWNEAHIGLDHGFVEAIRVVDDEATLLVMAESGFKRTTKLEAWRPILEGSGNGGWDNEWTVYSKAWAADWACNRQWPVMAMPAEVQRRWYPNASTPWPSADGTSAMPRVTASKYPWNAPTSLLLEPGESSELVLRLQRVFGSVNETTNRTGPGPRPRDSTLEAVGAAVLLGIPGYVLSPEMRSAKLLVLPPRNTKLVRITATSVGIGGGIIRVGTAVPLPNGKGFLAVPLSVPFPEFSEAVRRRGRVRITATFSDGTQAVAHYYVLPPFADQVQRLGQHLAHKAWLPRNTPDPFGRGASVMPWDRSANGGSGAHVLNDARAYDVGLSDDAGGGNPLCLASKVHSSPTIDEVGRVDEFIKWTLYGVKSDTAKPPFRSLQIGGDPATGCQDGENASKGVDCDGIRMTLFYYGMECDIHSYNGTLPPANWSGHWPWSYTEVDKCSGLSPVHPWCMGERNANATYRAFNYPHHTASYWAMYHVARFYDRIPTLRPWQWYLERAAKTALRFYAGTGVMDGTVFREVLRALLVEGNENTTFASWAEDLELRMKDRQRKWAQQRFPYGSEFSFDTTGQEEVVIWNMYFNNTVAAKATVDHILSYMRSIPSWAYNGGARAADSGNGGKWYAGWSAGKPDRGQMHYRSGLNMIPLIEWYRSNPDDFYLLRVATGAMSGQLTNIDESGAPSMMWHAYPWVMEFDPHSGDYGLGFFGNSLETGAYYIEHPRFGPTCFFCSIDHGLTRPSHRSAAVLITLEDAYRRRMYLEPLGLYVVAVVGTLAEVELDLPQHQLNIIFNATEWGTRPWSQLRLSLTKPAANRPGQNFILSAGGSIIEPEAADKTAYTFAPAVGATKLTLRWQ